MISHSRRCRKKYTALWVAGSVGSRETESYLLFRKLHICPQRVGEAVGQIGQADQQIEVNDLGVGKVELQALNICIGNRVRIAGEFLGEVQRGFLLFAEVAVL